MQLEKRVSALEQASPTNRIDTIIRRIVSLGHLGAEAQAVCSNDGRKWSRMPGESAGGLIDRAIRDVTRNPGCVARLVVSH